LIPKKKHGKAKTTDIGTREEQVPIPSRERLFEENRLDSGKGAP